MRFSNDVPKIHMYVGRSENGTKLTVQTARGEISAVVVPRPFVDPEKETPKGTYQEAAR